ncbi:hypothetical protein BDQ94DRAFT_135590 [Aspergillus welwitschiae]|uniref:Uncharacterized protein n=1 Tax=Aspergillus welwitschiae TaxID=1341132 RepID=A0A3F3QG78_9EURO|nr:hypothetical protein BDQ94DRAFT_135590 [Aspergillus welwitschiae]RDH38060.1 hypothetical protein BDQ94DRAFT_135590 [Aspergillus welwitschiae]
MNPPAGRLGGKRLRSSIPPWPELGTKELKGSSTFKFATFATGRKSHSIDTGLTTWVATRIQRVYEAFQCECMGDATAKSASEQYHTVSELRVRLRDASNLLRPIYWDQLIHSCALSSSLVWSLQPQ